MNPDYTMSQPQFNRPDRRAAYDSALTLSEFLATTTANQSLWAALAHRAIVPDDLVQRARSLPGSWHLLVLLEDWCGDAVNTIPVIARLAEYTPRITLRVLKRDEHPDLMEEHLTAGKRAIPVVMVLDDLFREAGWWGPRPNELQTWTTTRGVALSRTDRYREIRRWYAVDRGRKTIEELLLLICEAAGITRCHAA